MAKTDKLKNLEKLMEQAGMPTGAEAFNSDIFKKVAKGQKSPLPSAPDSGAKKNKAKISSATSSAPMASPQRGGSNFKNEMALKETKDELSEIKKSYYSLKNNITQVIEEANNQIKKFTFQKFEILLSNPNKWKEFSSDPQRVFNFLNTEYKNIKLLFSEYQKIVKGLETLTDSIKSTENGIEDRQYAIAVLVIDDSVTQRKMIRSNFETLNFRNILEAKTVQDALKVLDKYSRNLELPQIAFVAIDQDISGTSAVDFVRIIKNKSFIDKYPAYKNLKIFMLANRIDKLKLIEATQAGINEFMKKPVSKDVLEEKINKYL